MDGTPLFDFNDKVSTEDWRVVNDGVMGGLSQGIFSINSEGHGFFRGNVSLENYGGFSSVRYRFETKDTSKFSQIQIRLKGDGKPYQFRVKADDRQRYSYIANIKTSGDWEILSIEFSEMYPAFRGRLLDLPNYSGIEMTEIAFLIGNKKEENFALEIDYIELL
ncbi:CIA30 family protein [Maribacter algarum]|uniref:CIA30 family protein n=2 Tax=Maribacter algarum (ex Zhang et al. 2020) TaxID=2578118 RepID=A0A5S3QJ22_9FLAO|nr:CIA30 family protein [Maribacter algarum]